MLKKPDDKHGTRRPYPFKLCKGCLPQILLGTHLNTLSHMYFMHSQYISIDKLIGASQTNNLSKINLNLSKTNMVFTWDFISGKTKWSHFGVWSISYNCFHHTTQNEDHWGCYFNAVILLEIKFHFQVTKYHVNTTRSEIMRKETSSLAFISSKREWLTFTKWDVFLRPSPKRNFISFRPQWKQDLFYSGLNFHFGSHVNTL